MIVKALIVRDGRFLLGKRRDGGPPAVSGVWELLGGHVEEGESPREALKRELREELGVDSRLGELVYGGRMIFPDGREEFHVFRLDEMVGEFVLTEHVRVEWIEPGMFDEYNIYPNYRRCLRVVTGV